MSEQRLAFQKLNSALSIQAQSLANAEQALQFASDQLMAVLKQDAVLLRTNWALRAVVLASNLPANADATRAIIWPLAKLFADAVGTIVDAAPALQQRPAECHDAFRAVAGLLELYGREEAEPGYNLEDFLDQADHVGILANTLDAEHRWQMINLRSRGC